MGLKIYLAARFTRHAEMQDVAGILQAQGHTVTSRWHTGAHEMDKGVEPDSGVGQDLAARFAGEDLEDLMKASCVVSFTEPARTPTRGGRHVEFGYGLAYEKKMVIVGDREHVFHYLPQVIKFDGVAALLNWSAEQKPKPAAKQWNAVVGTPNPSNANGALFNNEESAAARAINGR